MADSVTDVMDSLVACACEALTAIDRPVCDNKCGLTVGPPMIGPSECCKCGDGPGGSVFGFLERTYPADAMTLEQVTRKEDCSPGVVAANITLVIARCYPTIDSQGNSPSMDATTDAAHDLNLDMAAVWTGLKCCGEQVRIRESAVDADPDGGCSAFAVRVTVPVSMFADLTVGS